MTFDIQQAESTFQEIIRANWDTSWIAIDGTIKPKNSFLGRLFSCGIDQRRYNVSKALAHVNGLLHSYIKPVAELSEGDAARRMKTAVQTAQKLQALVDRIEQVSGRGIFYRNIVNEQIVNQNFKELGQSIDHLIGQIVREQIRGGEAIVALEEQRADLVEDDTSSAAV